MSPSCARGSGELPPYVDRIDRRPPGGLVHLWSSSRLESALPFLTDSDLRLHCRELAEKRYLFSVGGRSWPGPADIMAEWQEVGEMPISFLQVAWSGPKEWEVHEIVPGAQQWELRPLRELLDSRPLLWADPHCH